MQDQTPKPAAPQDPRKARLSAALKANIARRKAQARAKDVSDDTAPEAEKDD